MGVREASYYRHIDPVLMAWAARHGITVITQDRGWDVRSFWICDRDGYRRGQLWMKDPDADGNVTVIAAELDPKSDTNWGPREERRVSRETLAASLEELWALMLGWGGPGAIASNTGLYPLDLQRRVPRWNYELGTATFSGKHANPQMLGWAIICLLLHLLSTAFLFLPDTMILSGVAQAVAEAVTIWPLLVFTSLILPVLLFVVIVAPPVPLRRAVTAGLIATLFLALVVTVFALLLQWRRHRPY